VITLPGSATLCNIKSASNILWISLRCNNLFTLMCIRSYLAQHVSATAIVRCYTLVLSLNYRAVMLNFILSLIMRMLYLSKIVNIKYNYQEVS
jgi:hypothetical protein